MKRFFAAVLAFCCLGCAAALPYIVVAAAGYGTAEVVDMVSDSSTTLEIGEGGTVNVTNEAQPLPDNVFGLIGYLLNNIYKVIALVLFVWIIPSPQSLYTKIKKLRAKIKEKI